MKRAGILVAIAACTPAQSGPAPTGEAVPPPTSTLALVRSMASLAGVTIEASTLEARARAIDAKELTPRALIDELVRDARFGNVVVPSLVFGSYANIRNYYALPSAFILQRDDAQVYFLRARCDAADAVRVRPWWDLSSTVKVCPDAYRPEKWTLSESEHGYKTKLGISCDSQVGSPEAENVSLCGCGPNLIRCLSGPEHYEAMTHSLMEEVRGSTAYVVEHDLPMSALFTSNETFRDRNAETYYRRQQAGTLETKKPEKTLEGLTAWPEGGTWAKRDEAVPGQHAGVLTSPQLLHWLPDRRQRQRAYYEVLWCTLRNTFGATTQKVLEINAAGNNFFVHQSWDKLAHTPLCTNCHARLDYGFQFFNGYPDSRASVHFVKSERREGSGPLYGRDIDDPRGEAPLTPQGFAKLATQQPEFAGCMTDHFVTYVLGDGATADDVAAIEQAVTKTGTFRAAMTAALERYALRWQQTPSPVVQPPQPKVATGLSPALRAMVDKFCVDCHDADPRDDDARADFTKELPRKLLVDMTDKVAFGVMPKAHALDVPTRERMVGLFIEQLWADPAARAEATRYFITGGRGLPAQQLDNVLFEIGRIAGAPSNIEWNALQRGLWTDQDSITPGLLTLVGLDALRACRTKSTEPLEACLTRSTQVQTLSRWPIDP